MVLKLYAIKDTVQGEFMNPFLMRNKEEAKRAFGIAVNSGNKGTSIVDFYKDMQLFELGEYNNVTGDTTSKVEFVCTGLDVKVVLEEVKEEV